ncbi:MAG: DUF2804 domain-containing protein [Lachnospiraceae bacterium]|nr:DUF2804 domain-containing protein [Lachnospiraceae bacterium]
MEHEVTKAQKLLNEQGLISEPGWARSEIWEYNRENINAPWFRRKEWDYYLFNTEDFALAFTISDLGYISLLSASFINIKEGWEKTDSELGVFPMGKKYGLGTSTKDAGASCSTKRLDMAFMNVDGGRTISMEFKNFAKQGITFNAELFVKEPDMEAVYIATPWKEKATAFYYNCKRNCLEATGVVKYGDKVYEIKPGTCFGVLDWGRGVWTYDNTWFWGTGSGKINGELFGFNLGYGFSDRSSASENGFYYKGRIHKLEEVVFDIPTDSSGKKDYLKPWSVYSKDKRLEATFAPILDRAACLDFKVIISDQHQVFGKLTGKVTMDDGETVEMKDFICAIEEVRNKY